MDNLTVIIQVLLAGGIGATILAIVAAIRRYKSGEILDDDALIARLDKDNLALRNEKAELQKMLEEERSRRWKAEDDAAEAIRRYRLYGGDPT